MRFDIDIAGKQVRSFGATKVSKARCGWRLRARVNDTLAYAISARSQEVDAHFLRLEELVRWRSTRVVRNTFTRPARCGRPRVKRAVIRCKPASGRYAHPSFEIHGSRAALPGGESQSRRGPFPLRDAVAIAPGAGGGQALLCGTGPRRPRDVDPDWDGCVGLISRPCVRPGDGVFFDRAVIVQRAEGDAAPLTEAILRGEPRRVVIVGTGSERRSTDHVRHRFQAVFTPVPRSFRVRVEGPAIPNPFAGGTHHSVWEGHACGFTPYGIPWEGTWKAYSLRPGHAGVDHGRWSAVFPAAELTVQPSRTVSYSGFVEDEPPEVAPGGYPWTLGGHPERREMSLAEVRGAGGVAQWVMRAREPVHTNAGDYVGDLLQEGQVTVAAESCQPARG